MGVDRLAKKFRSPQHGIWNIYLQNHHMEIFILSIDQLCEEYITKIQKYLHDKGNKMDF